MAGGERAKQIKENLKSNKQISEDAVKSANEFRENVGKYSKNTINGVFSMFPGAWDHAKKWSTILVGLPARSFYKGTVSRMNHKQRLGEAAALAQLKELARHKGFLTINEYGRNKARIQSDEGWVQDVDTTAGKYHSKRVIGRFLSGQGEGGASRKETDSQKRESSPDDPALPTNRRSMDGSRGGTDAPSAKPERVEPDVPDFRAASAVPGTSPEEMSKLFQELMETDKARANWKKICEFGKKFGEEPELILRRLGPGQSPMQPESIAEKGYPAGVLTAMDARENAAIVGNKI